MNTFLFTISALICISYAIPAQWQHAVQQQPKVQDNIKYISVPSEEAWVNSDASPANVYVSQTKPDLNDNQIDPQLWLGKSVQTPVYKKSGGPTKDTLFGEAPSSNSGLITHTNPTAHHGGVFIKKPDVPYIFQTLPSKYIEQTMPASHGKSEPMTAASAPSNAGWTAGTVGSNWKAISSQSMDADSWAPLPNIN